MSGSVVTLEIGDVVLWQSPPNDPRPESCVGVVLEVVPYDERFDNLARVDFWSLGTGAMQNDPEYVMQENLTVIGTLKDWNRGVFRV